MPAWSRKRRTSTTTAGVVFLTALTAWVRSGAVANPSGVDSFASFWSAAFQPALQGDFLRRMVEASLTTASFALLGTMLAVIIGVVFAPLIASTTWDLDRIPPGARRRVAAATRRAVWLASVLPRAIHEFVFALVLIQILGLDPIVAIVSIGVPFGAVTAKVFADMIDGASPEGSYALRAAGAPRMVALLAATAPTAKRDLLSYAFYRFECAMRSAAVLGIIGAGGLGYELALSFQSLRYGEVWTAIWFLVALSGFADRWSSWVRRSDAVVTATGASSSARSAIALVVAAPLAWWWVSPEISRLWRPQTRSLIVDLADRAWPPATGDLGLRGLALDSLDTFVISVLAITIAALGAVVMAFASGGGLRAAPDHPSLLVRVIEFATRSVMLLLRAVPPPVWAFVVVLVILPGIVPGAVALGLYNLGVLGRLMAEVLENDDDAASPSLRAAGAPSIVAFVAAAVPSIRQRWQGLTFYRWEVTVRDTVMVGTAGATGLGRTLTLELAGRAFDRALAALIALVLVTLLVDELARRAISPSSSGWRTRGERHLAST